MPEHRQEHSDSESQEAEGLRARAPRWLRAALNPYCFLTTCALLALACSWGIVVGAHEAEPPPPPPVRVAAASPKPRPKPKIKRPVKRAMQPRRKPKKVIYLTFDGGPSAGFNERALPVLKKHHAHVTWFVEGVYLMLDKKGAPRLAAAGDEIEVHTWTHPDLTRLGDPEIRMELQRTADAIYQQTGQRARFVRPPYGAHNKRTDAIMREMGYDVAMWNATCPDYKMTNPTAVANSIARQARPNAVVLLHVTKSTWRALPYLLTRLDKKGFTYAMLRDRPVPRQKTAKTQIAGFGTESVSRSISTAKAPIPVVHKHSP